jgi:hypothetical protein
MPSLKHSLILVYVVLGGVSSVARTQTYACLPANAERAQVLYNAVVSIVTGTDSQAVLTRNAYQLPAVAASKVSVVTTASVCRQAGVAYHTAVTPPGTPEISRTLVVIKVGTTRYVVLDPKQLTGEFRSNIVFDSQWRFLIGFTG